MKKKGFIITAIIGIVLLIVGITLLLLLPKKSNKELYADAIQRSLGLKTNKAVEENVEDSVGDAIEEIKDLIGDKYYKVSITGTSTQDEASFTKTDEVFYFGKDQIYINAKDNVNDVINKLEILLKDNRLYFNYENLLDHIYYIDKIDEFFKGAATGDETITKVAQYLIDAFDEAIKNDEVKVDSSELTINGNKYNTKSYGYTFTGNDLYDVITKFVDKVKKDDTVYKKVNELIKESGGAQEITQAEFNQMLDQVVEYAKEVKSLGNLLNYTVYLYKDEVISRQISINISTGQGLIPVSLVDYTVEGYYKAAVATMGYEMFALELKKQDETRTNISFTSMAQELLKGYFKNDSNSIELKLEGVEETMNNTFFYFTFDKKDATGSIKMESDSSKAEYEYSIEEVDEIPEMDVTGSLPFEEMTESDKEKIQKFASMFMPSNGSYNIANYDYSA